MARDYAYWLSHGRPYRLMRPAAAVQTKLRGYGLVVYDYPNKAHQQAPRPEDHTPFSVTGWPLPSAYGVGHALDVMPRADSAEARRENAMIARQLIRDRDAGVPGAMWIKYINWTDESGVCRQERWTDRRETRSSTDKGHIHISGRSDCDDDTRADDYDPMRRALGLDQEDDVQLDEELGQPIYIGDQTVTDPNLIPPHGDVTVRVALASAAQDARYARLAAASVRDEVRALREKLDAGGNGNAPQEIDYDRLADALLRGVARLARS